MNAIREKTAAYVTALYDVTVLLYRSPIADRTDSDDGEVIDAEVVSDSSGTGGSERGLIYVSTYRYLYQRYCRIEEPYGDGKA